MDKSLKSHLESKFLVEHNIRIEYLRTAIKERGLKGLYDHLCKIGAIDESFSSFKKQFTRTKGSNGIMNRLELIDPILQFLGIPASKVFGGAGSNKDPNVNVYDDVMRAFNDHEKKKQVNIIKTSSKQTKALCDIFKGYNNHIFPYKHLMCAAYNIHVGAKRSSEIWMKDETIQFLDYQIAHGFYKDLYCSFEKTFSNALFFWPKNDSNNCYKRFDYLLNISLIVSYQLLTLRIWMKYVEKKDFINDQEKKRILFFKVDDEKLLREFIIALDKISGSIKPMIEGYGKCVRGKISEFRMKEMNDKNESGAKLIIFLHMLIFSFLNGDDISLANEFPELINSKKLLGKYSSFLKVCKLVPLTNVVLDKLNEYSNSFANFNIYDELTEAILSSM